MYEYEGESLHEELNKKKVDWFDMLLRREVMNAHAHLLVAAFCGEVEWHNAFPLGEDGESIGTYLWPNDIEEQVRPHLADALARALKARNVTIEW